MIWTRKTLRENGFLSAQVFDANGDEIRFVESADDQTGECTVFRTKSNDSSQVLVTNRLEMHRRRIICKPPLRVVAEKTLDNAN
jgi:hypothetical protein